MRLRVLTLAGPALIALALVASVPAAGRPSLRVVRDLPLTVQGTSFRPRESVRVSVVMGPKQWSRSVRAGRLGGFTARFTGVRLDRCAIPLVISARRAGGATVRARLPVTECAMP